MWRLQRTASGFGSFFSTTMVQSTRDSFGSVFLRLLRSMSAVSATELDFDVSFASCVMRWSTVFIF